MSTEQTPRKPWWRRWFGSRSEHAAGRFLRRLGYRVVRWNYRCPHGEIDIIALDGSCLVFVEVRSTERADATRAAAWVDHGKQQRLTTLALYFLQQHRLLNNFARFDVLAISWPEGRKEPNIVHHKDAFPAVGRHQMYS
jgi:putative endonuclease